MDIDQGRLLQIKRDLNIRGAIVVKFDYGFSNGFAGLANPETRELTMQLGLGQYDEYSFRKQFGELKRIFLHEIRHFHQYDNWSADVLSAGETRVLQGTGGMQVVHYNPEMEADADKWAFDNAHNYSGLFRIRRRTVSKLARINSAERRARLG